MAMFDAYLHPIAAAYDAAPTLETSAIRGWCDLADDSERRAEGVRLLLNVQETDDAEPYPDAQSMCEDIANGRFVVSRANSEHPVWTVAQNVAFRIVHDVLGHYAASVARLKRDVPDLPPQYADWLAVADEYPDVIAGFDWAGENAACVEHVRLLDEPLARMALFTECIAQTGYAIERGGFGVQKVADLGTDLAKTAAGPAYSDWLRGVA